MLHDKGAKGRWERTISQNSENDTMNKEGKIGPFLLLVGFTEHSLETRASLALLVGGDYCSSQIASCFADFSLSRQLPGTLKVRAR